MTERDLPLVSVVVPVYNVENYLKECLDSILGQTYRNLQVIAVNDGSTDSSPQILADYDDSRLTVINQVNGGLAAARNTGLKHACGDFLIFVDSDDIIHPELLEIALKVIREKKVDLVRYDLESFVGQSPSPDSIKNSVTVSVWRGEAPIRQLYDKSTLVAATVACSKLYSRRIYSRLQFPTGKLHEDVAVALDVLLPDTAVAVIDKALYFYRRDNSSSIMSTPSWRHLDGLIFYEDHYKKLSEIDNPLANQALLAAFKTGLNYAVQYWADADKRFTLRYHRLVSHLRYLAQSIEPLGLSTLDKSIIKACRYMPNGAVLGYRIGLYLRGLAHKIRGKI